MSREENAALAGYKKVMAIPRLRKLAIEQEIARRAKENLQARRTLRRANRAAYNQSAEDKLAAAVEHDVAWLNRWGPTIAKFLKVYQILSEFGVQMAAALILGFVLMGLFRQPFSVFGLAAYAILIVTLAMRYMVTLAFIDKALAYAKVVCDLEAEGDECSQFYLTHEHLGYIRSEFLKASALQAVSLLVVLFFVGRILGNNTDVAMGISVKDVLSGSLVNMVGWLLTVGLGTSMWSARKFKSLSDGS